MEIPQTRSAVDYNNGIKSDIDPKFCKIICVVLSNPGFKRGIKSFLDKGGVPS